MVEIANCRWRKLCRQNWEEMVPLLSDGAGVRLCRECCRSVHLMSSEGKWDAAVKSGQCVAIRIPGTEKGDGRTHAGTPGSRNPD